jgi:hypothetical protein
MIKNLTTMKNSPASRQQEPAGKFSLLLLLLVTVVAGISQPRCVAQDVIPEGICRFTLALPEMEGPLTLGIFSPRGELVKLLYQNAPVDSIPAGLNGLLISWDGKDDSRAGVPPGTYWARGLVHGALAISALPQHDGDWQYLSLQDDALGDALIISRAPFPRNRITVMAAQDALFDKRPLLAITAQLQGDHVLVTVDGLPLLTIPTPGAGASPVVELRHGNDAGVAELSLILPQGRESYTIYGLDRLVPLNAGSLEMPSDTFHSSHESAGKP